MADQELSDEQLQQLLKDAAQRLSTAKHEQAPSSRSLVALQSSISKGSSEKPIKPLVTSTKKGAHVDPSFLVKPEERKLANKIRTVQDPLIIKANAAEAKKATAGEKWYNLPRTVITPELKRDLQLLRMRSVLDPKRHYKKESSRSEIPEYSQVGTIIEGPTEYFTGRLSNKQRKQTMVEEVLNTEAATGRFRNKYGEIQAAKTSGKKAHYKALKDKRRPTGRVSKG